MWSIFLTKPKICVYQIFLQSNINLHEKICASNWLKTSAYSHVTWYGCKVEIWVQITNSAGTLSKFCLSWLLVMFLRLHYKQLIKWFLLQFGARSTWNFFKDCKLHSPYGLIQFCCVWKIYQCLLTPNCKRNHATTFTNNMEIFCNCLRSAFSMEKSVLTLIKVW